MSLKPAFTRNFQHRGEEQGKCQVEKHWEPHPYASLYKEVLPTSMDPIYSYPAITSIPMAEVCSSNNDSSLGTIGSSIVVNNGDLSKQEPRRTPCRNLRSPEETRSGNFCQDVVGSFHKDNNNNRKDFFLEVCNSNDDASIETIDFCIFKSNTTKGQPVAVAPIPNTVTFGVMMATTSLFQL